MLSVRQCLAENELDRQKSEIILADILRVDKANLLAHPERRLNFWQYFKFLRAKRLLKKDVPLAYITGHKEFFGLDFLVNKNVLIPRPETEMMVETAIHEISNFQFPISNQILNFNDKILLIDIGTGTGCVPIAIASVIARSKTEAIPSSERSPRPCGARDDIAIFATDISRGALRVAKKNAKRHGVDIEFLRGNLLEPIVKSKLLNTNYKLLITANLPYLTAEQFASEPSIQREPKTALIADNSNGLSLYEKLFQQISKFLEIGNWKLEILAEVDPRQSAGALALAEKYFSKAKIEIKKDLAGHDRLVLIKIAKSNLIQ